MTNHKGDLKSASFRILLTQIAFVIVLFKKNIFNLELEGNMKEWTWLPVKFTAIAVLSGHRLGKQMKHGKCVLPYAQVWYLIQLKMIYFYLWQDQKWPMTLSADRISSKILFSYPHRRAIFSRVHQRQKNWWALCMHMFPCQPPLMIKHQRLLINSRNSI